MNAAYIIDITRTPVGKYGGALSGIRPDDLLARAISSLVSRNRCLDINSIEDVIAGDANQAGEDTRNVARMASLLAGLPVTVAGNTVNRLCASGLQAIMDAGRAIQCGEGEVYIAGGVESMSRAPFVIGRADYKSGKIAGNAFDTTIGWRFTNPELAKRYYPFNMGETAENVAAEWNITREEQDAYAFDSHRKFFEALEADKWKEEITPMEITDARLFGSGQHSELLANGVELISMDEPPRRITLEKLAALKPAFLENGTVTAGNSSGLNDGSAAMLLASEAAIKKYGFEPMARIVSMAVAGVDPSIMGMGPVPAVKKALQRAGLTLGDIDLIEMNESFAAQSIACIRELKADINRVNVNGGSIAIGHPLGCSGVRISATLLYEMKRRKAKYGLAALCAGLGQGVAVIYENLQA
ncbi:MAG: thiolase family protein [Flavitalea sp.]